VIGPPIERLSKSSAGVVAARRSRSSTVSNVIGSVFSSSSRRMFEPVTVNASITWVEGERCVSVAGGGAVCAHTETEAINNAIADVNERLGFIGGVSCSGKLSTYGRSRESTRTAAKFRQLAVAIAWLAVHENVAHALGKLLGLLIASTVTHGGEIEHDHIGKRSRSNHTAITHPKYRFAPNHYITAFAMRPRRGDECSQQAERTERE
jgi:hypothetical protein